MKDSASSSGCKAGITGSGSSLPNTPTMTNGSAAPAASPITEPIPASTTTWVR